MSNLENARAILAQRSPGANATIPFTVANGVDANGVPVLDRTSDAPLAIHYAMLKTNRVGITVVGPAGGTQDVLATHADRKPIRIELGKGEQTQKLLERLGETVPHHFALPELEVLLVERLLDNGYSVEMESPFAAAVRETEEEHGLRLGSEDAGQAARFRVAMMAKRMIGDAERAAGRPLFDLNGVNDLGALRSLAGTVFERINPAEQDFFAVYVPSMAGTSVVHKEKVESKIAGRLGQRFFERGTFATATGVGRLLSHALEGAARDGLKSDAHVRSELLAACDRLRVLEGIEAYLVPGLRSAGFAVESSADPSAALTPVEFIDVRRSVIDDLSTEPAAVEL